MITQVENCLDTDLLRQSKDYAYAMVHTPHLSAGKKPLTLGIREEFNECGIVLMHLMDIKSNLFMKLQNAISKKFDMNPNKIGISYMFSGSSLNWHKDFSPIVASITIYLNDEWDKNWGGLFMYTENDEITNDINAVFPKNNLAILQKNSNIWHSVSPTSKNAPIRVSLQMFQELPK